LLAFGSLELATLGKSPKIAVVQGAKVRAGCRIWASAGRYGRYLGIMQIPRPGSSVSNWACILASNELRLSCYEAAAGMTCAVDTRAVPASSRAFAAKRGCHVAQPALGQENSSTAASRQIDTAVKRKRVLAVSSWCGAP